MKKILFGLFLFAGLGFASAQTISLDKTTWDYGTIKTGSDGHRIFNVKNTGDKPLILSDVKASCGCTTPEYSKDPILPGKSAQIKVGYNTAINGNFKKMIEVFSNDPANGRTVIYIQGNVDANAPEKAVEVKKLTSAEQKVADKAAAKTKKDAEKAVKKAKTAKKVAA